jgi:hemoglobin
MSGPGHGNENTGSVTFVLGPGWHDRCNYLGMPSHKGTSCARKEDRRELIISSSHIIPIHQGERAMKCRILKIVVASLPLAALGWSGSAGAQDKSLYERLGGVGPISVVVDEFIDRLAADKVLNQNPAIKESRNRVPKSYLKFHVTTLMCEVTGGPCKYVGRSMKDSHVHLNIKEKEWNQMAKVFKAVLDKYKVPAKEQQELFEAVGKTKPDIVKADN